MKKFLKVVIWIAIIVGVCFGIYTVLPEYPKSMVQSFVQPIVNSQAKLMVGKIQNLKVSDIDELKDLTYKTVLEKNTGMSCWVYAMDEANPSIETVTYRGNGASLNLKDYGDYNGKLVTSAYVKVIFKITNGKNVTIEMYVDNQPMFINDNGQHDEMNKTLKKDLLSQMYNGMRAE